jgi:hypothetical protein
MYGAADERAHAAEGGGWWEAWQLDVANDDGIGIAVLLACTSRVAWWWTHVLVPGRSGPIVVRDHDVPLPRAGLELRADGLWGELLCETPFEHWTYGLEAFGVALDDPDESLRGEMGDRMPVGFDLEWEVDPAVGDVREHNGSLAGYAQFGVVHGELLLERQSLSIDGFGRRAHRWGVPDWALPCSSYWMRGADGAVAGDTHDPRAGQELGRFVAPVSVGAGSPGVVTRALWRFERGNGWSTRYEPE